MRKGKSFFHLPFVSFDFFLDSLLFRLLASFPLILNVLRLCPHWPLAACADAVLGGVAHVLSLELYAGTNLHRG